MFRRKEEGMDPIEGSTETNSSSAPSAAPSTPNAPSAPSSSGYTPPAAATASAPSAPSAPTAPSAAAPAPSFRPAAPQAAMAAARPSAPMAPSAPSAAPVATMADRMPAAPVARPNAKRVLTVGPDIQMKGEISSCDRVIIEGTVDATMRDVHTVELAETGSLKGTAEVEDAEISGSFEGDLIVRGRLTVHSSGRVRGNVTYGEIEISRGGQISGNIRNAADAKNQPQQQKKAA